MNTTQFHIPELVEPKPRKVRYVQKLNPWKFDLSPEKLRLLENRPMYDILKREHERDERISNQITNIALILAILIYIILSIVFIKNCDEELSVKVIIVLACCPELGLILYFLIAALLYGIHKIPTWLFSETRGWKFVKLFECDEENYLKYTIANDEYQHTILDIPWSDVTYKENQIEINISSRKVQILYPCESKDLYQAYKDKLKPSFRKLQAYNYDGQYYLLDENVLIESLIIIIKHIEAIEIEKTQKLEAFLKLNEEFRKSHNEQNIIIFDIKASKSHYLNFLMEHQDSEKDIIRAEERLIFNSSDNETFEKAYIFTICDYKGKYHVIYENENDSRASIVVEVFGEDTYYDCVRALFNYMHSRTTNKRETQHSTHRIESFYTNLVKHNDMASWQHRLTGKSYYRPTTTYRYIRRLT